VSGPFLIHFFIWTSPHPSPGPVWAIRLPNIRSSSPLLPHLYILPGARDTRKNLRPDRSKLPSGLRRRNDGHGHGSGQAQHRAGLFGGGKQQLRSCCWREMGLSRPWNGPDSKLLLWHIVYWGHLLNRCQSSVTSVTVWVFWNCPLLVPNMRLWIEPRHLWSKSWLL